MTTIQNKLDRLIKNSERNLNPEKWKQAVNERMERNGIQTVLFRKENESAE